MRAWFEISHRNGERVIVGDAIMWRPPTLDIEVRIDLDTLFAGQ